MLYKKASEMKPTPIPHCMGGEGTVMMERLLDAPAEMLGKGRAYVRHTLQKQVAAGIAGQAELGEHGQLHAAGCGLAQSHGDLPDVIGAVGHPQCGGKGGSFKKTIFHRRFSHPVFLS